MRLAAVMPVLGHQIEDPAADQLVARATRQPTARIVDVDVSAMLVGHEDAERRLLDHCPAQAIQGGFMRQMG